MKLWVFFLLSWAAGTAGQLLFGRGLGALPYSLVTAAAMGLIPAALMTGLAAVIPSARAGRVQGFTVPIIGFLVLTAFLIAGARY